MDVIDLIASARRLGLRISAEGERLIVEGTATPEAETVVMRLAANKQRILRLLEAASMAEQVCGNPLTPHSAHEHDWECDPESCDCYRQWRKPMWCKGVPCRWVWPDAQ